MKKILTVAVCKNTGEEIAAPNEETDVIYADGNAGDKAVYELIKKVKSKYTVLVDSDFRFADEEGFLKRLDEANDDIIIFDGGYLFKSAILKSLPAKICIDRYSAEIFASFNSKTVATVNLKPFIFSAVHTEYTEEIEARLSDALEEFKRSKAKLPKPVYSFIFDILCARLVTFYMSAMLAIYRREASPDALAEFDKKLKENIVLYLALNKRFTAAELEKLRGKNFKISFLQANKFKKLVKK